MPRHLMILASALAVAACSGGIKPNADEPALLAVLETTAAAEYEMGVNPGPPAASREQSTAQDALLVSPDPFHLSCEIVTARTSRGLRITPVVEPDRRMRAEYSLVVTTTNAGGSSDIEQGGPFNASGGDRLQLSSAEFSLERGARYRAVLSIREDGREICREEARS